MTPPHAANRDAMTCPRCGAAASFALEPQRCASCNGTFALYPGRLSDSSVVPPPFDASARTIRVKSAGLVLLKMGEVTPHGIAEGTLDPVTGMLPMDQSGVLFGDVKSIAVWRNVDVTRIVAALILPMPIALVLIFATIAGAPWPVLVIGLVFAAITAAMLRRAIAIGINRMRVAGAYRTITVRFDTMWNDPAKFHGEVLRRSGLPSSPLPR
jgi:hypothetical protein